MTSQTTAPGRIDEKRLIRYAQAARAAGVPRDQMENFLRAGIVLQPKQLQASAAARACDHEEGPEDIGFGGQRGGGKSHWMVAQLAADDCQRMPGINALLLRKVGKANKEHLQQLRVSVLSGVAHTYAEQAGILRFPNGSRIVAGHYQNERDIDAHLGLEYDIIALEEATTLTPSKLQVIRSCRRTSKAGWRPRMYYTFNPGGIGHAHFKKFFIIPWRQHSEKATRFIPAGVRDNRFVDKGYLSVLESLVGWERQAWLDGNWDIAAGQFFTNWRENLHVIPSGPAPKGWTYWAGMDYGFTHYTCCHLLAGRDGTTIVVDEHCERRWLPEQHAAAIKAMLARHGLGIHSLRSFVGGADMWSKDQHGHTVAEDYAAQGIHLRQADMDRVNGWAEILRRLGDPDREIEPRLFVMERCARLIETIPAMQHDPHRPEDVLKVDVDESGEGGDDSADCARYACMADRPAPGAPAVGGRPLVPSAFAKRPSTPPIRRM